MEQQHLQELEHALLISKLFSARSHKLDYLFIGAATELDRDDASCERTRLTTLQYKWNTNSSCAQTLEICHVEQVHYGGYFIITEQLEHAKLK